MNLQRTNSSERVAACSLPVFVRKRFEYIGKQSDCSSNDKTDNFNVESVIKKKLMDLSVYYQQEYTNKS